MSTDEKSVPMLALKFFRSGRAAATALENKGLTEFGVKLFAGFIWQTGVKRFLTCSDGENAMEALKEAAASACVEVEAMSRESPVGDHNANAEIESGVRQLKRQMRSIRLALEQRIGQVLGERDPILAWIPKFAGDVLAHYRRGSDGKTPWQRETGRRWTRPPHQPLQQEESEVPVRRQFYVKKADVTKYGYTPGCKSCAFPRQGRSSTIAHTPECRKRILEKVEDDDAERANAFHQKMISEAMRQQDTQESAPAAVTVVASAPAAEQDESMEPSKGAGSAGGTGKRAVPVLPAPPVEEEPVEEEEKKGQKRASETPAEELAERSAGAQPAPFRMPEEVPRSQHQNVEEIAAEAQQDAMLSSVDLATVKETAEVELGWGKRHLAELAHLGFQRQFREVPEEYSKEEVQELAVAALELGGADVVELYSPPRFTAAANELGLRPFCR